MRCQNLLLMLALISLATTGCSESTDPALASLQGEWRVVGMQDAYQSATAPEVKGMQWKIQGTEITAHDPDGSTGKMVFKIDSKNSPQAFDVTALSGNMKGIVELGMYELSADTLRICFRGNDSAEKGRPTEFTTEDDCWLMTLEKVWR